MTTPATPAPQPQTTSPEKELHVSVFFTQYYAAAVLFLIAAFLAVTFFVLRPRIENIKETNANITSKIAMIEQERAYLTSLDQSVAAAQSIQPLALKQIDQALPNSPQFPSLLLQMGAAAARHDIQIQTVGFSETHVTAPATGGAAQKSSQISPLDVTLELRAKNYFDVKRFLADIESSLRLMDVLAISANSAGGDLIYSVQLRTYYFRLPS